MTVAAILFGLTALGGLTMAGIRLKGEPYPPLWIALVHGGFGIAGFAALIYVWGTVGIPWLVAVAFWIFVLAALGGLALLTVFHLRGAALPIWMVLAHGSLALLGLTVLVFGVFR